MSPSSVRCVLAAQGLRVDPLGRAPRSVAEPFADWVDYKPNAICIYGTTHFTRAGVTVTVIEDLVSRKWIATTPASGQGASSGPFNCRRGRLRPKRSRHRGHRRLLLNDSGQAGPAVGSLC